MLLFGQYDTELIREIIRLSMASVVLIDAGDHCRRYLSFVRKYIIQFRVFSQED